MENRRRPNPSYVFSKALSVDDRQLDENSQNKRYSFSKSSTVGGSFDEDTGGPKQGSFFRTLETALDYNLEHPQIQGRPVKASSKAPGNKDYQQQFEDFKARRALLLHGVKIPQNKTPKETNGKKEEKLFTSPPRRYSTGTNVYDAAVLARQRAARKGPPPPVPPKKRERAGTFGVGNLPTVPDIREEATEPATTEIKSVSNDETKLKNSADSNNEYNVQNETTNRQVNSADKEKENSGKVDDIGHDTTGFVSTSDKKEETKDKNELDTVLESFPTVSEEGENKYETVVEEIKDTNEGQAVLESAKPTEEIEHEVTKTDQPDKKPASVVSQDLNDIVCEEKTPESQATLESFPDISEKPCSEEENVREEIKTDSETTFQTEDQTIFEISDVTVAEKVNKHSGTHQEQAEEKVALDSQFDLQNYAEQPAETVITESEQTLENPPAVINAELKPVEITEHPTESETNLQSSEKVGLQVQSNEETGLEKIKNAAQLEIETITIGSEPNSDTSPRVIAEFKTEKVTEHGGDFPGKDIANEEIKPETEVRVLQPANEAEPEIDARTGNLETHLEHISTIQGDVNTETNDDKSSTGTQLEVNEEISTEKTKLQEGNLSENEPEIGDKTIHGIVQADGIHLQSVVKELSETITSLENTLNDVHTSSDSNLSESELTKDISDQTKNIEIEDKSENNFQGELKLKIEGNDSVIDDELQFESQVENFPEDKNIVTEEETVDTHQLHNESVEQKTVESSQAPDETFVNLQTGGEPQIDSAQIIEDESAFESLQPTEDQILENSSQADHQILENSSQADHQILENSSQADPKATEKSQIRCENTDDVSDERPNTDTQRKLSKMAERLLSFSEDNNVAVDDAELSCVEKDLVMINKCFDDMSNGSAISIAEREEMDKQRKIENLRREMEEMK